MKRTMTPARDWPRRPTFLFVVLAFAGLLVAGCGMATDPGSPVPTGSNLPSSNSDVSGAMTSAPAITTTAPAPVITTVAPPPVQAPPVQAPPVQQAPDVGAACGTDSYVNVDGNCVHDPVQAPSAPAGATARCNDGTYSFSKHHSGTCSGHGGVAEWLN